MSNVDSRLKKYFEEYDSAAPVPAGLDDNQIEGILNGSADRDMPEKIMALCKIISSVESSINARLGENKSNISSVNISNNLTISSNPNDPEYSTKIVMAGADGGMGGSVANISLNVNVQKMLKLPAELMYAKVYALVESSVFDKVLEKSISEPDVENVQAVELVRNAEEAEKLTGENSKENKTLLGRIIKYVIDGIRGLFGANYPEEKIEAISKNIARDYSTAYGGVSEAYNEMFDASAIKSDPTVQELKVARRSKILQNAEKAAESDEPAKELSYREQAMALLSEDTKDAFEQMKGGSDSFAMQGFCSSFIADYLAANGFGPDDIEIVYVDDKSSPQGLFSPGNPARITINVAKVKDVTDMVMTIAHESKHAVDALYNGEKHERARLDNVAKSINCNKYGIMPGTPEYNFIKKLNSIAYHIDPNERRGREAELAGLEFMQQMAGGNSDTAREIEKNIAGFNRYQKNTISIIEGLVSGKGKYSMAALEEEFSAIGGLNLPENLRVAIREKLGYIQDRINEGLNSERERASIESSKQIAQDLKGREHLTEQELEDLQMQ